MIHATINGIAVEVEEGSTVLQAAEKYGIDIPTLCYLKDVDPEGSCRMCMVEIEGNPKLVTACSFPIAEGNVIHTESERVIASRRSTLDLLLSHHATDCFSCAQNGSCKLQDYCHRYGVEETSFPKDEFTEPIDDSPEFFTYNPNLCILCHRCVNTCQKLTGRGSIDTTYRGSKAMMSPAFGLKWSESNCEHCGCCVEACPVGALSKKGASKYRSWEVKHVRTTCPHCAVGCQYDLLVKDNRIVGVEAANGPSNRGWLCVKGRFGSYEFVHSGSRITDPLIKDRATGKFRKATWDEALDLVAEKFTEIKNTYGGDALAGFACSRSANEDIYMLQKMVRVAFGTNNTDNCARV